MSPATKKTQYKAGKLLFEEKLKARLKQASEMCANGKMARFAKHTRMVWVDCFNKDQEKILDLVENWSEKGEFTRLKGKKQFLKYVRTSPVSFRSHRFKGTKNSRIWEEIYRVIQEALRRRYSGGNATIKEDEIKDSFPHEIDEDEIPDDWSD